MKIKRFFAPDIRNALRQVRETLGSDAVILSNKTVDGGVELMAAVDYDEQAFAATSTPSPDSSSSTMANGPAQDGTVVQMHSSNSLSSAKPARSVQKPVEAQPSSKIEWSQDPILVEMRKEMQALRQMMENELSEMSWYDLDKRNPLSKELLRQLMGLGLGPEICHRLVKRIDNVESMEQAWRQTLYYLAREIPVAEDSPIDHGGVVALVGPTGVGKTTTVAKLAARFALRRGHRHVGLISTDNYRIGAQEQLNTYARILDVPVRTAGTPEELNLALNAMIDKQLVIIDTAGMSPRDVRLSEQLSMLHSGNRPVTTFLTLAATTQQAALEHTIEAFSSAEPSACIITKVDEAASLGGAISALINSKLPGVFITDGQKVPEDLHLARAHSLVSKAVALGAQEGTAVFSEEYMALALGGMRADAHG
ncbi:MAG: flagellar biosynthesis protein FlhF [Gammaproteobacteria bacterium]|nr:flagellar biosynthesis protein FlhF [Gammaproteobacteria bacterium]